MIANVRARYANGVLTLLEPLDLAEGAEVTLVIEETPRETVAPGANVLEDMSMLAKRLIEKYPDDGRDQPTDGSINYKPVGASAANDSPAASFLARMAALRATVSSDAWDGAPTDFSKNKKH